MIGHSHLFKNFPQFVVIHTVKGFSAVNKVEVDVFLEFLCLLHDTANVGNLISGPYICLNILLISISWCTHTSV